MDFRVVFGILGTILGCFGSLCPPAPPPPTKLKNYNKEFATPGKIPADANGADPKSVQCDSFNRIKTRIYQNLHLQWNAEIGTNWPPDFRQRRNRDKSVPILALH